jgi:hypothetical protein
VPFEAALLSVIEVYLDRLAARFPGAIKRKAGDSDAPLSRWQARSPLFVGRDPEPHSRAALPGCDCGRKHYGTGPVEVATLLNDLAVVFRRGK